MQADGSSPRGRVGRPSGSSCAVRSPLTQAAARSHLDTLIARELSSRDLPPGVAVTRLGDGTAEIACPGLYTATLTLAPLHLSADLVRMRRRAAAQRNPSTREDAEPSDGARMVWHWVVQDVSVSPGAALGAQVFPDQAADLVAMLQGHITGELSSSWHGCHGWARGAYGQWQPSCPLTPPAESSASAAP